MAVGNGPPAPLYSTSSSSWECGARACTFIFTLLERFPLGVLAAMADHAPVLGCFFQCTTRRSSTGTSSLPTCSWEMMATSKLLILESAISLKGMMPSFPARQGRQPSWHPRPSHRLAKVSVERWVFAHSWHLLGPPGMAQRAVHTCILTVVQIRVGIQ